MITAIAIALLATAACSSNTGATKRTDGAQRTEVEIKLVAYKPAVLHVSVGTTVTWHQLDPGVHTVTAGTVEATAGGVTPRPNGMFSSGELPTGASYSHRFTEPGTYTFFCEIHPATMRGRIVVG